MNILIVSQRYAPEQFQINEIAPELVRRGHRVTVLTGVPNYPQGEIYDGYEKGKRREETVDGVRIIRVRERPRKHGKLNLLRNYLSFAFFGARRARRLPGDFDLVLCYQLSPVSMLRPAVAYARKYKKPLLCYCLDIWPESAKDHMPIRFIYRMIGAYARRMYAACDRIAVTSEPFMEYLTRVNGVDPRKMEYIPQHADASMLGMDLSAEENGIADFLYAGNFGKAQTLQVIIRAAAELKDRSDFRVHMVGDGSRRGELETLARELGVAEKFVFYGNQPRASMPDFYRKADALLLTLRGNNEVGNTMPGKLQTYMTVGKPIFGAINGAADQVIRASDCGRCVPAGDAEGLARLMREYLNHPERFAACGANARRYFGEHFTFEIYMSALESAMERTVNREMDHGRA